MRRIAGLAVVLGVLAWGQVAQAAPIVIFNDDFDNEISADPPSGWVQLNTGSLPVSLETSATSSVRLSNATATTRISSTGLPTFNPQAPSVVLTLDIVSLSVVALGGMANGASITNSVLRGSPGQRNPESEELGRWDLLRQFTDDACRLHWRLRGDYIPAGRNRIPGYDGFRL